MTLALKDVKDHLRGEHGDEDYLIDSYLQAAISNAESITGTRITQAQVPKKFSELSAER